MKDWQLTLLFLLSAVFLIGLVAYFNPPINPETYCCDHLYYRSMAFNFFKITRSDLNTIPPGNSLWNFYSDPYWSKFIKLENYLNRQPPYAYRIITPLLARAIGRLFFCDRVEYGFYLISFLALTFTTFLISLILYFLTHNVIVSVLGSIVFSSFKWTTSFYISDYMLVDPLAFFFITLAVFFMLRKRKAAFFLTCLLGMFNKETVGLLIPCYLLNELLEDRLRMHSIMGAASVIIIYSVFRNMVPIPINTYSLKNVFMGMPPWQSIIVHFFSSFGILTFFTLSRMWLSNFTLSLSPLAVSSLIILSFVSDKQRMVAYIFPLVLFSVLGLRITSKRSFILLIFPVLIYFFAEVMQGWIHLKTRTLFLIEFSIFILLESIFFYEYYRHNRRVRGTIC